MVVFGVTFSPSEWSGTVENMRHTLAGMYLLQDRELSKSDLAKTMLLSSPSTGEKLAFHGNFSIIFKREGIESSLNCNVNVDLMDGNMIGEIIFKLTDNALKNLTSAYSGFVPVSIAVVVSCIRQTHTPQVAQRTL